MDKQGQPLTKLNKQEVNVKNFLILKALKKKMKTKRCTILLDIDETIITPLYSWTDHIKDRLALKDLTSQQIKQSGSLEGFFLGLPQYSEFEEIIEELRTGEEYYRDLPVIDGALRGIRQIQMMPNIFLGAYLTTRPASVEKVTDRSLHERGFPPLPIIARPESIPREATVSWKLSVLEELAKNYQGRILLVDDGIPIAEAIRARNKRATNFIVAVLYKGPLTYFTVEKEKIITSPEEHFYVADWQDIPSICAKYALS